jgi:hypothetical protein
MVWHVMHAYFWHLATGVLVIQQLLSIIHFCPQHIHEQGILGFVVLHFSAFAWQLDLVGRQLHANCLEQHFNNACIAFAWMLAPIARVSAILGLP